MHLKYLYGIFFLLLFGLMGTTCQRPPDTLAPLYGKTWLHAVEEDSTNVTVYRPNTYAFPPSRGRTGFSLDANGDFKLLSIAPTDGLEEHQGRWKMVEKDLMRVTFAETEAESFYFRIKTVTPDLFKTIRVTKP